VAAKFAAFSLLIVLGRENIEFVVDYVVTTYGRNFVTLSE
jgi:hypothetical protein